MDVHQISITGHRDQNEDKHDVIKNIDNKNPNINNINFYAVYDGHGGKEISAYLHEAMPKFFLHKHMKYPLCKPDVYKVYNIVQNNLKKLPSSKTTGSTCLIVVQFVHNSYYYINVLNTGDSRCVLCRDNFAMPLTKDHKPGWVEEKNRIALMGGKTVYDGFDWRIKDLSVSRAFGDLDATPYVTHKPDIFRYKLEKSDKFLVIACDGLWDVMSNSDVVNFVLSNCFDITTKKRVSTNENAAKQLEEYALKKGSTDNITVIVVFLVR